MNILITNDDGIDSPGIYALARNFINEGNIIISAPDRQRSASSHSITMHRPIPVRETRFFDIDCRAYAVSGTPVDCVKLAYDKLAKNRIDFVISGINDGGNLGTDVLYSGTVSAAIEGTLLGIPSMAVSLLRGENSRDYDTAAHYAYLIYQKLIQQEIMPGIVLNINVPSCSAHEIKGVSATSLGIRKYSDSYEERTDPRGNVYYWLTGDIVKNENGSTTDIYAVENNYVSITPMHYELTHHGSMDVIRSWQF